jgi:DNA polymerase III alpha subunit
MLAVRTVPTTQTRLTYHKRKMITNQYGEIVYNEDDICDLIMAGRNAINMPNLIIDHNVDIESLVSLVEDPGALLTWSFPENSNVSVAEFDKRKQCNWQMPDEYRQIDIAEHVLTLCTTQEELQRCGEELLMFQERDLFDLLRYLRYLVSVMHDNNIIWGVGRGSSVSSYVLYLLGVHRINSMYYDLDPHEFLR